MISDPLETFFLILLWRGCCFCTDWIRCWTSDSSGQTQNVWTRWVTSCVEPSYQQEVIKCARAGHSVLRQVFETWICDYRWSVWFCWTLAMKIETWCYWRPCACLLWCPCTGHWWAAPVQQRHMQSFGLDVHMVSLWKLQCGPNGTVVRYKMTSLVKPVFICLCRTVTWCTRLWKKYYE